MICIIGIKVSVKKGKFVTNVYPKGRLAVYMLISTASYPEFIKFV